MRILLAVLFALVAAPALACGPETDCTVLGDRTYRMYVPDVDGPVGAFFHAHGYRGSANGAMRNGDLRSMADRLGLAYVALNADAGLWNLAHQPRAPQQIEAQEFAYVDAVLEDVAARIDLDEGRLVATGFSAGGMMTWTLACGLSDRFAGFVPYSGTFWSPVPDTCPTPPATLIHIHGTEDRTVPIAGRRIGQTSQGDVMRALDMYAAQGSFAPPAPAPALDGLDCTFRQNGTAELGFCLFEGGHSYSVARVEWAIERILTGL